MGAHFFHVKHETTVAFFLHLIMRTVAEYARSIGKSRFTVYRWIKAGKIENVKKVCGRMLIYETGDKD